MYFKGYTEKSTLLLPYLPHKIKGKLETRKPPIYPVLAMKTQGRRGTFHSFPLNSVCN